MSLFNYSLCNELAQIDNDLSSLVHWIYFNYKYINRFTRVYSSLIMALLLRFLLFSSAGISQLV